MRRKEDEKLDGKAKQSEFVGKQYTPELGRQMPYGAIISSKGIIKRVMTEEDYPDLMCR
jgi:hypothetical protein